MYIVPLPRQSLIGEMSVTSFIVTLSSLQKIFSLQSLILMEQTNVIKQVLMQSCFEV